MLASGIVRDDGGSVLWVDVGIIVSVPMSWVLGVRGGILEFALPLVNCLGSCCLL